MCLLCANCVLSYHLTVPEWTAPIAYQHISNISHSQQTCSLVHLRLPTLSQNWFTQSLPQQVLSYYAIVLSTHTTVYHLTPQHHTTVLHHTESAACSLRVFTPLAEHTKLAQFWQHHVVYHFTPHRHISVSHHTELDQPNTHLNQSQRHHP